MNIGGLTSIPTNSAPRQMSMGGQPHMLAYINPQEAQLLKDRGGMGIASLGGIPAFYNPSDDMGMEDSIGDMTEVSAGMGATSSSGDPGIGNVTFSVDDKGNISTIGGPNTNMGDTMTDVNFSGNQGYSPGDVSTTNLGVGGYNTLGTGRNTNTNLGYEISNFFNNLTPADIAKGGITALSLISNPLQGLAQTISKGMTLNDLVGAAQGKGSGLFGSASDMVSSISKGLNEQAKGN
tara:strand:- start:805 stop:1512 length:708 start_codon:yes stop_codon:yes gene_type:complete